MQVKSEVNRKLKVNNISDKGGKNHETERSISRKQENTDFTSVIIKRNDQAVRHPDDTLELAILTGIEQHKRPWFSLFLSSLAAGLILGFAGMCVALTTQLFPNSENLYLNRLSIALVYPLGFIVSIISGTQLFTEHTATALYPVLDQQENVKSLFTLWGVVLVGNLFGTLCSSILLFLSDSMIYARNGFIEISNGLLVYAPHEIFIGAILAGWLMAQAGWLVLASPSSTGQVLCIYIITFIIGYGGLPHSIAGASEIFSGIFHSKTPNYWGSILFVVSAALGNLLGGTLFVGVLNYAHIKKMQ